MQLSFATTETPFCVIIIIIIIIITFLRAQTYDCIPTIGASIALANPSGRTSVEPGVRAAADRSPAAASTAVTQLHWPTHQNADIRSTHLNAAFECVGLTLCLPLLRR